MAAKRRTSHEDAELRQRAEERLRSEAPALPQGDPRRILHELQVHQIQLEMQNSELRDARTNLEVLVDKYTDLYDFAPVGYFSLDASARIKEVNLTGAAMLGIERSRLLHRLFTGFVSASSRPVFNEFLENIFANRDKQLCELALDDGADGPLWVDLQGTRTTYPAEMEPLCRLAVSDITELKRAAEAQRRVEELKTMNEALEREVSRRRMTEKSLLDSQQRQSRLLEESQQMQEQLRLLSHQILHVQEEERRRISVDLHDEIAQTLVAINVHLASLARDAAAGGASSPMRGKIAETQKLVEQSVESVHRFAMGLRPTVLDDLGLIPALRAYIRDFRKQTKLPVHFRTSGELRPLGDTATVALYRVAQAALSNAAQHADANVIYLMIRQTQRSLHMEISDDGKGFSLKESDADTKPNRLGLIGMQERVEMLRGKFTVRSSPGKGTTIRVMLPTTKTNPSNTLGDKL